jgi:hypothetical protein
VAGNTRGGDDDAEGDDGGETLADRPGESPSSKRGILRRRPAVFVLMIANVETLSGSKPSTHTPAYKAEAEVIGKASQSSLTNRSNALIAGHA